MFSFASTLTVAAAVAFLCAIRSVESADNSGVRPIDVTILCDESPDVDNVFYQQLYQTVMTVFAPMDEYATYHVRMCGQKKCTVHGPKNRKHGTPTFWMDFGSLEAVWNTGTTSPHCTQWIPSMGTRGTVTECLRYTKENIFYDSEVVIDNLSAYPDLIVLTGNGELEESDRVAAKKWASRLLYDNKDRTFIYLYYTKKTDADFQTSVMPKLIDMMTDPGKIFKYDNATFDKTLAAMGEAMCYVFSQSISGCKKQTDGSCSIPVTYIKRPPNTAAWKRPPCASLPDTKTGVIPCSMEACGCDSAYPWPVVNITEKCVNGTTSFTIHRDVGTTNCSKEKTIDCPTVTIPYNVVTTERSKLITYLTIAISVIVVLIIVFVVGIFVIIHHKKRKRRRAAKAKAAANMSQRSTASQTGGASQASRAGGASQVSQAGGASQKSRASPSSQSQRRKKGGASPRSTNKSGGGKKKK